jgi:hypothetical protein
VKYPGQFVPIDVNLPSDESIAAAGVDAEHLYVRGLMYCKRVGKDGFIPTYELPIISARLSRVPGRVAALVREELWVPVDGGWRVRSWSRWNATTSEEKERRDRDAERQRKRRSTVNPGDVTADVQRDTAVSHSPKVIEGRRELEDTDVTPPVQLRSVPAKVAENPAPKQPRRTRIRDNWQPSEALVVWTRENAPNLDGRAEVVKFVNYHQAKGSTMASWDAAWRTWVGNALTFAAERNRPAQPDRSIAADGSYVGYAL